MEDVYDEFGNRKYHLNLIQYYALYDPNGEEGLIQGLRYYPRNTSTVIPNNPLLKTSINYYKPYTNPRVVLPKPRYPKKLSSSNKGKVNPNKNTLNTLYQQNDLNYQSNDNVNNVKDDGNKNTNGNEECYKTYTRSYEKDNSA